MTIEIQLNTIWTHKRTGHRARVYTTGPGGNGGRRIGIVWLRRQRAQAAEFSADQFLREFKPGGGAC